MIKPLRPKPLSGVYMEEKGNVACTTSEGLEKIMIHIQDMSTYADQLEILLESITGE